MLEKLLSELLRDAQDNFLGHLLRIALRFRSEKKEYR